MAREPEGTLINRRRRTGRAMSAASSRSGQTARPARNDREKPVAKC